MNCHYHKDIRVEFDVKLAITHEGKLHILKCVHDAEVIPWIGGNYMTTIRRFFEQLSCADAD